MLISSIENRRYFSDFTGSAGYLVISGSDTFLATDFRYIEQANRQSPNFTIERTSKELRWFVKLASDLRLKRIGFESNDMTVGTLSGFNRAIIDAGLSEDMELVESDNFLDKMRSVKYEDEVSLLERAINITDSALDRIVPTIVAGMTEKSVAWQLEKTMRELGAEAMAFEIIVGAGPNGALPHHIADDTMIRHGEPIVIDMGARYQGYCADLTRTITVGEPNEKFREIYDVVLRAQLAAEEKVRPGMTGSEVDSIARDIIASAGYAENFGHSLGHGVGMAVHEHPHVGVGASDHLENGMVFTIEPGVYLPNWGGVRIEDVVILENNRARVMSKAHKLKCIRSRQ